MDKPKHHRAKHAAGPSDPSARKRQPWQTPKLIVASGRSTELQINNYGTDGTPASGYYFKYYS